MGVREKHEELEQLFKQGIKVYSISKLDTFNNCEYEYWKTYIKHDKQLPNIYSEMGGNVHDSIEKLYHNNEIINNCIKIFNDKIFELGMSKCNFPSVDIKNHYIADITHYFNNFKKISNIETIMTEKFILFNLDGIWLQMYIDAIIPDLTTNSLMIFDWKTSSKYSKKEKIEHGRQLLLYKLGLENISGYKVSKLAWNMLKYCNVCFKQKNGKIAQSTQERYKWVEGLINKLKVDLREYGITDELQIEILINDAIHNNSLSNLPNEIQNKYIIQDALVEYEATEENINELKQYIKSTVEKINKKSILELDWIPKEITDKNNYYCSVLCGHRHTCPNYKKYIEDNKNKFKNGKEENNNLNDKQTVNDMFKQLFGSN